MIIDVIAYKIDTEPMIQIAEWVHQVYHIKEIIVLPIEIQASNSREGNIDLYLYLYFTYP